MNPWEFILVISIAGLLYSAWKSKHLAGLGAYEDDNDKIQRIDRRRETELEREVKELRERVKVLERIATDSRDTHLLSDEIDKLRDK
jgi:hypothetical protein